MGVSWFLTQTTVSYGQKKAPGVLHQGLFENLFTQTLMQYVVPRSVSARQNNRLRDKHGLLHDEHAMD